MQHTFAEKMTVDAKGLEQFTDESDDYFNKILSPIRKMCLPAFVDWSGAQIINSI